MNNADSRNTANENDKHSLQKRATGILAMAGLLFELRARAG